MTLLDSNILGTFARVGRLSLLFDLFGTEPLGLTPAVFAEVRAGIEHGATFLQEVIDLVDVGQLALVSLTSEEIRSTLALPTSFGSGERDSVAVCQAQGLVMVTNDKRVRNFCRAEGMVAVLDLNGVLRALWETGVLSKRQVRALIQNIEIQENLVFKNKEEIFVRV